MSAIFIQDHLEAEPPAALEEDVEEEDVRLAARERARRIEDDAERQAFAGWASL